MLQQALHHTHVCTCARVHTHGTHVTAHGHGVAARAHVPVGVQIPAGARTRVFLRPLLYTRVHTRGPCSALPVLAHTCAQVVITRRAVLHACGVTRTQDCLAWETVTHVLHAEDRDTRRTVTRAASHASTRSVTHALRGEPRRVHGCCTENSVARACGQRCTPAALHTRTEKTRVCHQTVHGAPSHAYTHPHAEESDRGCYTSAHTQGSAAHACGAVLRARRGSVMRVLLHTHGRERDGWRTRV